MAEPIIITTLKGKSGWLGVECGGCQGSGKLVGFCDEFPLVDGKCSKWPEYCRGCEPCPACTDGTRPLTEEEIYTLVGTYLKTKSDLPATVETRKETDSPIKLDGQPVRWMKVTG